MKKVTVDESRWPLVVVTYRESLSDEDLDAHFDDMRALLARGEQHVMLSDFSHALPTKGAGARSKVGDFMKETSPLSARLCQGTGYVVANPIMRGGLKAIFWMNPQPYPSAFFKTMAEGLAWAEPFVERIHAQQAPSENKGR